jgi:hypothetical protein
VDRYRLPRFLPQTAPRSFDDSDSEGSEVVHGRALRSIAPDEEDTMPRMLLDNYKYLKIEILQICLYIVYFFLKYTDITKSVGVV